MKLTQWNGNLLRRKALVAVALVIILALATAACKSAVPAATAPVSDSARASSASVKDNSAAAGKAQVVKISADDAIKLMKENPATVLLDVRTEAEYAQGHIAGSQLLPVEALADRAGELPNDKTTPIIVYCHSGRRSAIAAAQLVEMGYTQVNDLGGIQDWPYDIVK